MALFRMKGFDIEQGEAAMKVGTDGTLLAAYLIRWLRDERGFSPTRLLDVGTGTGVIALMLAKSFPRAEVEAVEVEERAAQTAEHNFRTSPFCRRMRLHRGDFVTFASSPEQSPYDLIVSNPPYHNGSTLPPDERRGLARHADSLTPEELLAGVRRLTRPGSLIALIVPTEAQLRYETAAADEELQPLHRCAIRTTSSKPTKRLIEIFAPKASDRVPTKDRVTIYHEGAYTAEYAELMRDFLTIF